MSRVQSNRFRGFSNVGKGCGNFVYKKVVDNVAQSKECPVTRGNLWRHGIDPVISSMNSSPLPTFYRVGYRRYVVRWIEQPPPLIILCLYLTSAAMIESSNFVAKWSRGILGCGTQLETSRYCPRQVPAFPALPAFFRTRISSMELWVMNMLGLSQCARCRANPLQFLMKIIIFFRQNSFFRSFSI